MHDASITALVKSLSSTPRRMRALSKGFTARELAQRPVKDAWSVNEILAHLRCCADVWGRGIERMLDEDHPTWRHVSPRSYVGRTNYLELGFEESLVAFSSQRAALVKCLKDLPANGWRRCATVTGTTQREQTVHGLVERMALHEERHVDQVRRTIAAL